MSLTPFSDTPEKITVQAFKRSGKYYTSYTVDIHTRVDEETNSVYMQDIFDNIQRMIKEGALPLNLYYLVDHPTGYPGLVNVPEVRYA